MTGEMVEKGPKLLWASGPLRITVKKGRVTLLGAEYEEGEEILIHRDRSYTLELGEDATVEFQGSWGSVRDATEEEREVHMQWASTVAAIREECGSGCRVLVMGPTDSGKTSFITMLANTLLREGSRSVWLLDTDLGQSTLGFPGFVSMARVSERLLWNRVPRPHMMYFVGSITPAGWEHQVIAASIALASQASGETLLVDTDGWFQGSRALVYKLELARALQADIIVVLEADELWRRGACALPGRVVWLRSPPNRVVRSGRERRLLRADKLYLLEGVEKMLVRPDETPFVGTLTLGLGTPLGREQLETLSSNSVGAPIIYGEEREGVVHLLVKGRPRRVLPDMVIVSTNIIQGLLVALSDEKGRDYSYGIISGFDEARGSIVLRVPEGSPQPRVVRTGVVRFDGESLVQDPRLRSFQKTPARGEVKRGWEQVEKHGQVT